MQFIYPAIVKRNEDGTYSCRVPDLMGCEARADTLDEVMEEAHNAAADWISVELEEEDAVLPPVTDHDDLSLKEGEMLRNVCVTLRFTEGWEE